MKRKTALAVCLLLLLLAALSSCGKKYHVKPSQEISNVKSIQIATNNLEVVTDVDLSRAQEVYDDIAQLEYWHYFPSKVETSSKCGFVMLITYEDGKYDIISEREPQIEGKLSTLTMSYRLCGVIPTNLPSLSTAISTNKTSTT